MRTSSTRSCTVRWQRSASLQSSEGHASGYCAIDIANQEQADAVIATLSPLVETGTLIWEWADPVVTD